jgi:hypothetical protein
MKAQDLVANVATLDRRLAAGTVGFTLCRGASSFSEGGVVPASSFSYVVVQVSPDGAPQLRGYKSAFSVPKCEMVVGGGQHNPLAYDLLGLKGRAFPADNHGLAGTAWRVLTEMAKGPEMTADQVELPEILVEFPMDKLMRPVNTPTLRGAVRKIQSGQPWVLPLTSLQAPVSGQVMELRATSSDAEWSYYVIQDETGRNRDIPIPHKSAGQPRVGDMVVQGQPMCQLTSQTPRRVVEDVIWGEVQTRSKCGLFARMPLEFVKPLLRQGCVPTAVYEDVTLLLGVQGPDIHREVRKHTCLEHPAASFDGPQRNRAVACGRAQLSWLSSFATDDDIINSMDGGPIVLSGMPVVQSWHVRKMEDMRLRRVDTYADFGGLRSTWENMLGKMDPAVCSARYAQEVLAAAVEAVSQVPAEMAGEVAASTVMAGHGSPETVGMLQLLGRHGTAAAVLEYLEASLAKAQTADTR